MPTRTTTKKRAKKSTKRRTVKSKATKAKSRKTPKRAHQELLSAEGEQCFWVHDGPVLVTLVDLHDALHAISDDQYLYHAEGDTNDFAEWVEYVLCDRACATALRKARRRLTAANAVKRRLALYVY